MMTSPSVSMEDYQEAEQMQVGEQTAGQVEESLEEEESSSAPSEPQTPMEVYKTAIYRHPLFPLLALLFEKCEQSTQSSECVTSASFDVDIENFVRNQEKEGKAFFSEDPDLDNLMVKAIQVLRIHLLELEKVNDLCKDFCSRYIACLKTKMNSETLLSGEPGSPYSPTQTQVRPKTLCLIISAQELTALHMFSSQPLSSFSGAMSPQGIVVPASALQQGNVTVTAVNPTQVVTGGTVYQPVTVVTPQGQVVTQTLSPGTIRIQNSQLQLQLNQDLNFFSQEDNSSKAKRGILPKHATNVMRSWLFQHIGHPYPTEDEKKQIALQTNLTLLQVNNWFINARRRILQPMLDASSSDTPKSKKKTPQTRPLQRFWPNSLASSVSQQQVTMEDGTMVTVGVGEDGLQTLSSDGATLAMQQVMMGGHSEEDDDDDEEDEEDEDNDPSHSDMTRLGLETSDSL
ncbi:homeobox protein PKNOX1 isoform X1 [Cyprinus carpio]|uniref:Homeobox protein PKNOX1 isoform X1 n=1 Tax=Cyprinus carpio TaxID=7962 RepID=A0A9Q9ZTF7_CYPCA|nr:homeobox protein PKNOX1 isoform X1 [Cyprinus carpio]XP_042573351.1 homeobox protein PKNOX1 isoform X1 [Cyprinus carpio]XP_042573352.1 homeobox protein PKNOX1 isoform X1 [Cyprinus carpio]XP_042573353.1 homeobox protein PKNOX1 isoform X1 [Cyprinus carpio]